MLQRVYVIILLLSFIVISTQNTSASQNEEKAKSKIGIAMMPSGSGFSDLEKEVFSNLKSALTEKDIYSKNQENMDFELLVTATPVENSNKAALSLVVLGIIPEEAVKWGAENELFYTVMDEEKIKNLPASGAEVRKYFSGEYMKQFRMVWDSQLDIIKESDIAEWSKKIAEKFSKKNN